MIASCAQFYLEPSHLDTIDAVPVPELIDGNGGGEQSLVGPLEHLLHMIERGS